MNKRTNHRVNWDIVGMFASIACAIHCAVLPIFLTSLSLFGLDIVENPIFEYSMILLAFIVGMLALRHGKKHHHSNKPYAFFFVGFLFLVLKEVFHNYHTELLIPAVIFILVAHIYNIKLEKQSKAKNKIAIL